MKYSSIVTSLLFATVAATASPSRAQSIGNQDIILMLNAHVADSIIISRINTPTAQIDTSTQSIIDLARAGASDEVMAAILAKGTSRSPLQPKQSQPDPIDQPTVAEFEMAQVEFASLSVSQSLIRVNIKIKNIFRNPIYVFGNKQGNIIYGSGGGNLAHCESVSLTDEQGNDYPCISQTLNGYADSSGGVMYEHNGKGIQPNQKINVQYVFTIPTGTTPGNSYSISADPYIMPWWNFSDLTSQIDKQVFTNGRFGSTSSIAFSFDGLQKSKPATTQPQPRR